MPTTDTTTWEETLSLLPGYDSFGTAARGEFFDEESAEHACDFFAECLTHTKGDQAGQPLALRPWQRAIVGAIFGWRRADGTRRYREVFVYVPRKNGKTTLLAGVADYLLMCDGELGAEIYAAAADKDQARLLFGQAKAMIQQDEWMNEQCRIFRDYIEHQDTRGMLKVISADAATKHGYNSHGVLIDELHAQPDRELVDVLETSTGSRKQPLVLYITTADYDRPSICNEVYHRACQVRDGVLVDSSMLPVIYEAGRDEDWTDPSVWAKANPNLGVSLREEYMESQVAKAMSTPSHENKVRRLHLNQRTEQDERWLSLAAWDRNADRRDPSRGSLCYGGLDMANTTDVTALVLLFPDGDGGFDVLFRAWAPADGADQRERLQKVPYQTWAADPDVGLTLTPGDYCDHEQVRDDILELSEQYHIAELTIDPREAASISTQLSNAGLAITHFTQVHSNFNESVGLLEKLIGEGKFRHRGNPMLRWMASNVALHENGAGHKMPSKKRSPEKIDGIVAALMALARATVTQGESVYESRGLIEL